MDGYKFQFGSQLVEAPWWWLDALLIWLGLLGVVLWLLGRRLVKPSFAVVGLVLGAAFAAAFMRSQWPDMAVAPWAIFGGIIGAVAAWMFWRLLVAGTLGGTVAIVAPWAVLAWTGVMMPDLWAPIPASQERITASVEQTGMIDVPALVGEVQAAIGETWGAWWESLEGSTRWTLLGGAVGAGSLALLIGLALPRLGASLATALLGVVLMLGGLTRLAGFAPETAAAYLPDTPRELVIAVLAGAVIGAVIQWTIFRKATDS